jgi:hypothetical protein
MSNLEKKKKTIGNLKNNYKMLWEMSDEELGRENNPTTIITEGYDLVYKKIWDLWGLAFKEENDNLQKYFKNLMYEGFEKRKMKQGEYAYFFNNSIEKIFKDKKKEDLDKSMESFSRKYFNINISKFFGGK